MKKHYINLTNGIEYIKELKDYSFIRIQSTACEQKRWFYIINALSDDFILNCVLGNTCIVYDCSNKKEVPRAIFQGVEWIKFVFNKYFLEKEYVPNVRGNHCGSFFDSEYRKSSFDNKLKYFKKFLNTDSINIQTVSKQCENDGNYEYFKNQLTK